MADIIFVTGGCRSGKSDYAQRLAESLSAARAFVATAPVTDEEMHQRIEAHRQARAHRGWQTIEEQLDVAGVFRGHAQFDLLLVDCITLWVNNLMYEAQRAGNEIGEAEVAARCEELLAAAAARRGWVLIVSNEVGLGVVPENALARRYRDLVGRANQLIAARAATVTLMTCGIPWHLKQEHAA